MTTFAEKLKSARKQSGMSQEKLAEAIGVSRQTVTKWETSLGLPDIENLKALSTLFAISLDELLCDDAINKEGKVQVYESVTEIDVDRKKRFDMNFGGTNSVEMVGYDGEKLRICLFSPTLPGIQSDLKLKIDDIKNRMDLMLFRLNDMTEAMVKESLSVLIRLPQKYLTDVELAVHADRVTVRNLEGHVELDGRIHEILLDGVVGRVEVNCNSDLNVCCRTLCGSVEINQLSATSRITLPEAADFRILKKGMRNRISYERAGSPTGPFDEPSSDNLIELNGAKSELIICKN